jgi:uncharacterized protein (UPF0332 family)
VRNDLAKYRLEDGKEKIESAEILFNNNKYKDSASRSYYAIFSAARALLATKGLDSSKHTGIIALFNQHFAKTGVVKKEMSKLLAGAKVARERSDYADFVIISKDEALEQIQAAKEFLEEIEKALKDM